MSNYIDLLKTSMWALFKILFMEMTSLRGKFGRLRRVCADPAPPKASTYLIAQNLRITLRDLAHTIGFYILQVETNTWQRKSKSIIRAICNQNGGPSGICCSHCFHSPQKMRKQMLNGLWPHTRFIFDGPQASELAGEATCGLRHWLKLAVY